MDYQYLEGYLCNHTRAFYLEEVSGVNEETEGHILETFFDMKCHMMKHGDEYI